MQDYATLATRLDEAVRAKPELGAVCEIIAALAAAATEISAIVSIGALNGEISATVGMSADGEARRALDLRAQDILMEALRNAPVASVASAGLEDWAKLDPGHELAVAFVPIDESSNFEANLPVGTIFSILPAKGADNPFVGRRSAQLAAGFFLYGPQTNLVVTLGEGVDVYTFDLRDQTWRLAQTQAIIPAGAREYAINAANYRHWEEPVRAYVDDCLKGVDRPRAKSSNMRWIGSLAADTFRILTRGGVYLYPADKRAAYRQGRLRLIYEAHPMSFIVEQAGGKASTGRMRVVDISAASLHQRAPLIFGCSEQVSLIERLHTAPADRTDVAPLFGHRGLFRT